MLDLLAVFGVSTCLCLVLTPLARALARRSGLVDRPDGRRKLHASAVPVAGGLAILLAAASAFLLALTLSESLRSACAESEQYLLGLLLAAITICLVGVADDYVRLRGRHKLLGQLAAVTIVIGFGVEVRSVNLFGQDVELGLLAIPFTIFLLLGAINSLNLIDGMDGLLTTVGLIVCLALAAVAFLSGRLPAACVALGLGGALLGFLRYNLPPASIFLGDAGSMLIGLVVGVLAIQTSLKAPATVALATPAALLTVPIFDTTAAILRRKLTGRSIYTTDRGHLHHCLQRRGLSSYRILALVGGLCLLTVVGVLTSLALNNELVAVLSGVAVVAILVAFRLFGHAEVCLLAQRLRSFALSFLKNSDGTARASEVRLQGSVNWNALWRRVVAGGSDLNLVRIRLDVNAPSLNEGYHARWDRPCDEAEEAAVWRAEIPFEAHGRAIGRLEIIGRHDDEPQWKKLSALAELVEDVELTVRELTRGRPAAPRPRPERRRKPTALVGDGLGARSPS